MNEWNFVRSMALRIGKGGHSDAQRRQALDDWAQTHAQWLGLSRKHHWNAARDALAQTETQAEAQAGTPHVITVITMLAEALHLAAFDAALLRWIVAVDRLPRLAALATVWSQHGGDLPALLGELAGAQLANIQGAGIQDADRAVRRSLAVRLGLVDFQVNRQGIVEVNIRWALNRVFDKVMTDQDCVVAALIGARQPAHLMLEDFAHVRDADFLVRLLSGSVRERTPGINILIHGPPGTGKTELARTLAQAAGLALHGVGEADDDGEEPTRWDRVNALQLAQRVIGTSDHAVLLFDEMEDLIGDAKPSGGDWYANRQGSKVFINRLLETNAVPVIWTTNTIGNVDGAILRRMSFVLKLDLPSPGAARRMLARIAAEEGGPCHPDVEALFDRAPEAPTVLRTAVRAAKLAQESDGGARVVTRLVEALRGACLPPMLDGQLDLDLFESDPPIAPLVAQLAGSTAVDMSLLLTGAPGTGKTALAHHLARAMDRPLVVKRASDLLSRWVGGTEAAIASTFAEARERGHALLFDEVDSLLFDRASAHHSWEAGQVNEMLTWLDHHPLPVMAATNHAHRLDPAALRRFAFKVELLPLSPERAARAFTRFFGLPAPAALAELPHLTPGDFAAVRRQLRHTPHTGPHDLAERLRREMSWRPAKGRLGF